MYDIIADEIEKFEQDEAKGLSTTHSNNYLRESHYEDEFTRQEIKFMQARVQEAIEDYLHMNEIESFKVYSDWCVHVIDKELYGNLMNYREDDPSNHIKFDETTFAPEYTLGIEDTGRVERIEFTKEEIQEFEKADKEDEEFIYDIYTGIENLHLKEIESDLEHALEVGSVVFTTPEDKVVLKLLLRLVKEKLKDNYKQ